MKPEELARHTEGLVGSDIYGICERAAIRAIDRFLISGEENIECLMIDTDDMYWATNEVISMKKLHPFDKMAH